MQRGQPSSPSLRDLTALLFELARPLCGTTAQQHNKITRNTASTGIIRDDWRKQLATSTAATRACSVSKPGSLQWLRTDLDTSFGICAVHYPYNLLLRTRTSTHTSKLVLSLSPESCDYRLPSTRDTRLPAAHRHSCKEACPSCFFSRQP